MNDKLETRALQAGPEPLRPLGAAIVEKPRVFTVKLRVAAPLDHLIAQLYRAWPKLGARKDN